MPIKQFPYNAVINFVEYNPEKEHLTIAYKNPKTGTRKYEKVPKEVFYGLYYLQTATELLAYYAKNLKKKYGIVKN